MKIPIISKRRRAIEDRAIAITLKAIDKSLIEVGAIEKSFLIGNAASQISPAKARRA